MKKNEKLKILEIRNENSKSNWKINNYDKKIVKIFFEEIVEQK